MVADQENKKGSEKEGDAAKAKAEAKKAAGDAARARAKKAKEEAAAASVKIAAPGETKISPSKTPRLATQYKNKVVPALMKEFQFKNPMEVPRLTKVVINCAVKEAVANPKVLDGTYEEIMAISGQKPVLTRARKAIAAFKVRSGNAVGVMVTLRRARMYEFLDRLMNVALPRVRDFKGVNAKGFDGRGNFSMGIREQIIFPEINYDKVDKVRGMTVTITTTAKKNEHARALLAELGMPFRK
ncbi:MAG: 50S ribosomal protein L5 [Bdellovibrio sp.]|nr:50S ribosomal protein L5 [Bdellovibrio sp.]